MSKAGRTIRTVTGSTLAGTGELALVKAIRRRFGKRSRHVIMGIGDDAAVYSPAPAMRTLATTDIMAEGVHFDLSYTAPHHLGFKLVSVNASDIYAMGGEPAHMLLNLAMPGTLGIRFIDSFLDGIERGLKLYRMTLTGGDISSSKAGLVLSATVLGYTRKPLMRSGARPGDGIFVTGPLGDAACGFEIARVMKRPPDLESSASWARPLLRRHLMPEARKPGAWARKATAMMDISDGLLIDLYRLCEESRVGARIEKASIPVSPAMGAASLKLGLDAMELALSGGEDYELLFTAPAQKYRGAFRIGSITRGRGIVMVSEDARAVRMSPKGYEHFGGGRG